MSYIGWYRRADGSPSVKVSTRLCSIAPVRYGDPDRWKVFPNSAQQEHSQEGPKKVYCNKRLPGGWTCFIEFHGLDNMQMNDKSGKLLVLSRSYH